MSTGVILRKKTIVIFLCLVLLALLIFQALRAYERSGIVWSRNYGGGSYAIGESVVQTSDGGFALAGDTGSYGAWFPNAWLIKTDNEGRKEWDKEFSYEGGGKKAFSVVQTSDGGFALAGRYWKHAWLIKADNEGRKEWDKEFGYKRRDEEAFSVVQTSDGGFALASSFKKADLIKTDAEGREEWSRTFGGKNDDQAYSLVQTSDGGYALAGGTKSFGAGSHDFWLVKTDNQGNEEWSRTFGGEWRDVATSLVQTSDGGYALAGWTCSFGAGSWDAWLVKTDSKGNKEWSRTFGGEDFDVARSLVQTSDGGFALAGRTYSFGSGEDDAWLVKTDPQGNKEWSRTFGGEWRDVATSLVQTRAGGFVLTGYWGGHACLFKVKGSPVGGVGAWVWTVAGIVVSVIVVFLYWRF